MEPRKAAPSKSIPGIASASRRLHRRYPMALGVSWKLAHGRETLDTGTGTTIDLSSGGLLFQTDRELRVGLSIELSIAWPVLLRNVAPLQLKAVGDIVRTEGRRLAVRFRHHEFRTVGIVLARRAPGTAVAPYASAPVLSASRAPK
ncbi:MAG: PilZ domain-containing protein [Acidobacteriia bacterium]|nr:PilZ domain-containing protein [Terriglobia bacterium]